MFPHLRLKEHSGTPGACLAQDGLHVSLQAAIHDEATIEPGVVRLALAAPAKVVKEFPCRKWPEFLKLLTHVLLGDRAELVNAPLRDQVLEASLPAVIATAIVTLHRDNCLHGMEDILLHQQRGHDPHFTVCQIHTTGAIPPRP